MSEYQYYEFLTIDQPLSNEQMSALRRISSRARITPVSFVNEYHWGDLKADPKDLMRRFFDVHLYLANWGSATLMVRLPLDAMEARVLDAFAGGEYLEVTRLPDHWLLTWWAGEGDGDIGYEEMEGSGHMASLAPIREELLRGDYRSLYLGWLRSVMDGIFEPDETEPMALSGLGQWTPAQQALAELVELDPDLLAGAGIGCSDENSGEMDEGGLDVWLDTLPKAEVRGYLRQLLEGEGIGAERSLRRRFDAWRAETNPRLSQDRRTIEELEALAAQAEEIRLKGQAAAQRQREAKARKAREEKLLQIANHPDVQWQVADSAAEKRSGRSYDLACSTLMELREAYAMRKNLPEFQRRLARFIEENQGRRALMERLAKAGLKSVG